MVSITLILLVLFMNENEDIDVLYSIEIHSVLHSKFQVLTFQTVGLVSISHCPERSRTRRIEENIFNIKNYLLLLLKHLKYCLLMNGWNLDAREIMIMIEEFITLYLHTLLLFSCTK